MQGAKKKPLILLGLTGSIGMGKSTTSQYFKQANIPVHDADHIVHQLYENEAVSAVSALFPDVLIDGKIDRKILSSHVLGDENKENMRKLEAIIHPLVRSAEAKFRQAAKEAGSRLVILDIPLLFETNRENDVDGVIVVTAPRSVQRSRVMAREGMTEVKFKAILDRQMSDAIKREKADFIIDTSLGLENAQKAVQEIINLIHSGSWESKLKK